MTKLKNIQNTIPKKESLFWKYMAHENYGNGTHLHTILTFTSCTTTSALLSIIAAHVTQNIQTSSNLKTATIISSLITISIIITNTIIGRIRYQKYRRKHKII